MFFEGREECYLTTLLIAEIIWPVWYMKKYKYRWVVELAQSQCRYYAHQRLLFLEHSAQGYAYLDLRLVKQISGLFIISRGTSL